MGLFNINVVQTHISVVYCLDEPCQHNGTCVSNTLDFTCMCRPGMISGGVL